MLSAASAFRIPPAAAIFCSALIAGCSNLPLTGEQPEALAAPAAQVYKFSDIMGAGVSEIDELLGPPSLTRREGDGEYRRYTLKQCELIIVLYPDEFGAPVATHIDSAAQRAGSAKPDLVDCLAAG